MGKSTIAKSEIRDKRVSSREGRNRNSRTYRQKPRLTTPHHRVIAAIPLAAHAVGDTVGLEDRLMILIRVGCRDGTSEPPGTVGLTMRNSSFPFRSGVSSSRSSFIGPLLPFVRSARTCRTQRLSADAVRSNSRATPPTALPSSRTSRTAPSSSPQRTVGGGAGHDLLSTCGASSYPPFGRCLRNRIKPHQHHCPRIIGAIT